MTRVIARAPRLLVAFALAAAAWPHATACAQTELRTRIDTTFAFNKSAWVDLSLVSGEIIVTGWTRQEARVVARLEREGQLETTLTSSRIYIRARARRGRLGEGRYELMVPIGTRVQATSTSGDIQIRATAGEVQVNTTSGDVEVLDANDRIAIQTISGDVHAEKLAGRTRIGTTSGDLEIDDVTGDLNVHAVSSEIRLYHVKSSQVSVTTVSGDIEYAGTVDANGSYEFSTHSSDVRVELPSDAGATLELQTYSGEISSRFPMTLQPGDRGRRGKRYDFTIGSGGAGGARVTIETFSGDITIERGPRSGRGE